MRNLWRFLTWTATLPAILLTGCASTDATEPASTLRLTLGPETTLGRTAGRGQWEASLRVSPRQGVLAVCCSLDSDAARGVPQGTGVFTSRDAGATWQLKSFERLPGWDPVCDFGPDGTLYVAWLQHEPHRRLVLVSSTDDGRTWSDVLHVDGRDTKPDHEMIAVDRTDGPHRGRIYLAAQSEEGIVVWRSDDGRTFTASRPLPNWKRGFVHPLAVLRDGTLVIPFATAQTLFTRLDGNREVFGGTFANHFVLTSADGGVSFAGPFPTVLRFRGPKGGGVAAATLRSGPHRGGERIYLLYNSLQLSWSDDRGRTWSRPRRIVPPGTLRGSAGASTLCVDARGVVGISWLQATAGRYDVWFAASDDAGESFTAPQRITTVASRTDSDAMRYPGGDYLLTDCSPDGTFWVLWPHVAEGAEDQELRVRRVMVSLAGAAPVRRR